MFGNEMERTGDAGIRHREAGKGKHHGAQVTAPMACGISSRLHAAIYVYESGRESAGD